MRTVSGSKRGAWSINEYNFNINIKIINIMKRLKFLFLSMAALLIGVPQAKAQRMIGAIVNPDEFKDGMEIVLETRSGTNSAGHYCPSTLVEDKDGMHGSITVPSIMEINDSVIWVLEKASTPAYKTGYDQYYLKSKVTGKYLSFGWTHNASWIWLDKWNKGAGTPSTTIADDTAHAKPFCFIQNSDETWAEELGSKKYGSFPANWDVSTYVVVSLFDPNSTLIPEIPSLGLNPNNTDGNSWGRVYLANEYPSYNITYLTGYQDTNVWDVRKIITRDTDPRGALQALCDNIQGDIESEFKLGTDPGYISDSQAYESFFNALNDALVAIDDASVSNDQLNTLFDKLYAANDAIYGESAREAVTDGYYYIKTANSAFVDVDNGKYGWYNDGGNRLRWEAMDSTNNKYIWYIKNEGDTVLANTSYKLYSFRNALTGKYISCATSHDNSQPVAMTDGFESRNNLMLCLNLDHSGQFNITSATDWLTYPPRPYHQEGHDSGNGTSGGIVLWEGQKSSPSAWYIHRVPESVLSHMGDYADYDDLVLKVAKYASTTSGAVVGDGVGMADSTLLANADSALVRAQAALKLTDRRSAEITAARDNLVAKMEAFKKDVNTVPDGYYRFKSNYNIYANNENYIYLNVYNDSTPGWAHLENTTDYIWKVTNLSDGNFTIQNAKNGKYLNKAAAPQNGSIVSLTDQPVTEQCLRTIKPNGRWAVYNVVDSTFSLDPHDHYKCLYDEGPIHLWSPADETGGTSWSLIPVAEDELNSLKAAEADNELAVSLKKKFWEARRAYNAKTNYTLGEKILTDASQLYGNNFSTNEGTNIGNLIDGDKNTTWCSTWEGGQEQNPTEPHYLRAYDEAGFPDTVQVNYVQRQNGTWHRVPSSLRIDVSNDAQTWTTLPWAEMRLDDFGGKSTLETVHSDSLHYIVSGIGGYKYVRFVTRCAYRGADGVYIGPNAHFVFEYAEFNLYPVTGVSTDSYSQTGTHKAYADALFSAIQAAYPLVKEGKGTQVALDKLTTALDQFYSIDSNDSVITMARFNVERLTAGDAIGQVPQDVHDTYVAKATDLLNKYDAATTGGTFTSETATNTVNGLIDAFKAVQANVHSVQSGKWYYIESAAPEGTTAEADGYYSKARDEVRGAALYVLASDDKGMTETNYNDGNQLRWGMDDIKSNKRPTDGDADALWCFTPVPDSLGYGANAYYIRNMHTGYYMGRDNGLSDKLLFQNSTPYPYSITFIGGDQFHIAPLTGDAKGRNISFGSNARQVRYDDMTTYYDNIASLTFRELSLEDNPTIMLPLPNNTISIVCLPFAVEGLNGAAAYGVHSKVDDTTLGLEEKSSFAAGEPMILVTGDTALYSSDHSNVDIEVTTPSTDLAAKPDTANGLIGTFVQTEDRVPGSGYFEFSKFKSVLTQTTIAAFSGYVNTGLTVNKQGDPDATISLTGTGFLNKIQKVDTTAPGKVDVYSVDGVLLKRGVDAAKATEGLQKGVYIIGGKAKLVK